MQAKKSNLRVPKIRIIKNNVSKSEVSSPRSIKSKCSFNQIPSSPLFKRVLLQNQNKSIFLKKSKDFLDSREKSKDYGWKPPLASEPMSPASRNKHNSDSGIFVKLNQVLAPKVKYFSMKKLSSSTLLQSSNCPKAAIRFKVNQLSPLSISKKMSKTYMNDTLADDKLVLGTEITLSKLYSQSIKIQEILRNNQSHHYLERKLKDLNASIHRENTRLALSYFSL